VVESASGPVEAADLLLEDGTVLADVPFASFRFAERPEAPHRHPPPGTGCMLLLIACYLGLFVLWPLLPAFRLALDGWSWLWGESAAD
jgi:hypothetical protein